MFRKAIDDKKVILLAMQCPGRRESSPAPRIRRWMASLALLMVIGAPFLFGMSNPGQALAVNQLAMPVSSQQKAMTPLGDVLNEDGTLNMEGGFSGSLDPKGWRMVDEQGKAPRFVPADASSEKPQSPTAPGDEKWDDRFVLPGTNNAVLAMAVSPIDGAIYVGGSFTSVGGVPANNMAVWNGRSWAGLGSGTNGTVNAIVIHTSFVFVGGAFTTAGGVTVNHLGMWNTAGSTWAPLGYNGNFGTNGTINTISIYDPGSAHVYVGGTFSTAGGVQANNIAEFISTGWAALGSGTNAVVNVITLVPENGSIFVGGAFTTAGGAPASRIALWDSSASQWSALGSGVNGPVYAMALKNTSLYVGGTFGMAGGVTANNIAKLEAGAVWSAMGTGANGLVYAVAVNSSGDVYVGGTFTTSGGGPASRIAKWNGSAWSALGSGANAAVQAIVVTGNSVYAGGQFSMAGAETVNYVGKWNGSTWSAMGFGVNNTIHAIAVSHTGEVFVGGSFTMVGGVPANHVARWDGSNWRALGSGTNGSTVYAIAISGFNVYVGGIFTTAGGVSANNIARYSGGTWFAMGAGTSGPVYAIADGGDYVYAGGLFSAPGNNIARWNGTAWSPLYTGTDGVVQGMAVNGTSVYAVGDFQYAGDVLVKYVAMWNGTGWYPLGTPPDIGINGPGSAVAIGNGNVYVVGHFNLAGPFAVHNVARWDGSSWFPMGNVEDNANSVAVGINGIVFVGGSFNVPGNHIAAWDGSSWRTLGSGTDGNVYALAAKDFGLYVGGAFNLAGGKPSAHLGVWYEWGQPTATPTPTASNTPSPTGTPGGATPTATACGVQYTDVPVGSTFYTYVMCLSCRGLISGYPCGAAGEPCNGNNDPYYRPNVVVTRGQLSKIVANSAGFNEDPNPQIFEDVPPGSTFYDWINRLSRRGYMNGYVCGRPEPCVAPGNRPYFRPGDQGTRGQLAKIVSNAAGFNDVPTGQIFSDVEPGSTFYEYVQRLASRGIIGGYACGGVNPGTGGPEPCDGQNRPYYRTGNEVTRGQVAKIAVGAFFPGCAAIQPTPPPGTTPTPSATPVCSTGTYVFVGPEGIPHLGSLSMPFTFSGGVGAIQDVNFAGLDITHGWIGDLRLTLRSPAGTQMRLADQICNGGPYINFDNITLDDNASQNIGTGCSPAAGGTYRPSEPLSIFNGQDANGIWVLYIDDLQSGYAGTLNGFTLQVTTCPSGYEVKR